MLMNSPMQGCMLNTPAYGQVVDPCRSLLETAKPYLMNCIRLPAAQTLLLFGYAIDTNWGISRIVCDGWLALDFPQPGSGLLLLSRAIELRRRWSSRLYDKLNGAYALVLSVSQVLLNILLTHPAELNSNEKATSCAPPKAAGHDHDDTLWSDLLDFMGLDVVYGIKRLLPADQKTLYTRCPPPARMMLLPANPFVQDYPLSVNSEKGGLNISEHVVYGCLAELPWTLAMETALQTQLWRCAHCDFQLEQFDVPDQLLHRLQCKAQSDGKRRQRRQTSPDPKAIVPASSSSSRSNGCDYHCESCGRHLRLSQIDILRHRRTCVKHKELPTKAI